MMIETERLFLREMKESDFDALYKVLADSDIMQHYPYTFDENRVRNWIQRNIERYHSRLFQIRRWGNYGIEPRDATYSPRGRVYTHTQSL